MCEFLIEHDSFTGFILTMYLLIIPMLCNMAWQDSKISYIRWYFTKGDYINYLGFSIFIVISSGSSISILDSIRQVRSIELKSASIIAFCSQYAIIYVNV